MRNKIIAVILIIMMMLLSTSCSSVKNDNATIQVWWYKYSNSEMYTDSVEKVLGQLKMYCFYEDIPIEIVKFDEDKWAYEDYILKRNVAMANGNMITIDDASKFHEIGKHHADYSKVENYNNLIDVHKDKFFVPIGIGYQSHTIKNEILEFYGISTDRKTITYDDYLDIKQQIREKGGKFRLNKGEYREIIEYYLIRNGLTYISEDSEIINDKEKFKEAIKKATIEIYESFKLYYKDCDNFDFLYKEKRSDEDYVIYDENSELDLYRYQSSNWYIVSDYNDEMLTDQIIDLTFVVDNYNFYSPCIYMHKKITNDKIYDVFNKLLDESYYFIASAETFSNYTPVQNTDKIREFFEVDDNWNYDGDYINLANSGDENYKELISLINETNDMFFKNEQTANLLASYYYRNKEYSASIYSCVSSIVYKLVADKLDYNTPEGENFINNAIDEFITNFNVHYN